MFERIRQYYLTWLWISRSIRPRAAPSLLDNEIVLVRDLRGRFRVLLQERYKDSSKEQRESLDKFTQEFSEGLGKYGFEPDRTVLYAGDLMQGDEIFVSSDRRLIAEGNDLKIWLLDRQIIGQDWIRGPLQRKTKNPRVTFWAWHPA